MKKTLIAVLLVLCAMQNSCKNPLAGINLYIKYDYFKYTVIMRLQDATHPTTVKISNPTITVSGDAAQYIFDQNGNKNFKLRDDGTVEFTVKPVIAPTDDAPLIFNVNISAVNYIPITKMVTISPDQTNQRFNVRMLFIANDNVELNRSISLGSGGGIVKPSFTGTRTTGGFDTGLKKATVYLPVGTKFYYYTAPDGSICGTKLTPVTHDSTVEFGGSTVLYHPVTGYYQKENASIPSSFTKTNYMGSTINVYYVYSNISSNISAYTYGTSVNTIKTLSSTSTIPENQLLFNSIAQKKLIDIYFTGTVGGQEISISPYSSYNWLISYALDTTTVINPKTNTLFTAGDSVEVGISYGTKNYPLIHPAGTTFTPAANVPTLKAAIRRDTNYQTNHILRVDCQSTDVGVYKQAASITPFSIQFNTFMDTNSSTNSDFIPDIENLYAYATLNLTGTSTYFNYYISPQNSKATGNLAVSGTIASSTTLPSVNASYKVYYWDSAISSQRNIVGSAPINTFSGPFIYHNTDPNSTLFQQAAAFDFSFKCAASGTPRIVHPNFDGSFNGSANGGVRTKVNVHATAGHWKTRGVQVGSKHDTIMGDACGTIIPVIFDSISTNNIKMVENQTICNCFHL